MIEHIFDIEFILYEKISAKISTPVIDITNVIMFHHKHIYYEIILSSTFNIHFYKLPPSTEFLVKMVILRLGYMLCKKYNASFNIFCILNTSKNKFYVSFTRFTNGNVFQHKRLRHSILFLFSFIAIMLRTVCRLVAGVSSRNKSAMLPVALMHIKQKTHYVAML